MISSLNLLPPNYKKEIGRSKTLLLIHEVALLMFIAVVFGSSVMFAARMMLEEKFREVILEQVPGTAEVAKINKNIYDINKRIAALDKITSDFTYLSPTTIKLIKNTPNGIVWNAFRIEENNKFTLSGTSAARSDLIKFVENLKSDPEISDIGLPLQYLVEESNIDFTIQGTINESYLKNPI